MTPKTDLQKLFEAALKDTSDLKGNRPRLTQAAPASPRTAAAITPLFVKPVAPPRTEPETARETESGTDAPAPDFDKQLADELGAQLDEKAASQRRQRKRAALVSLCVLAALTVGPAVWFVQSPERVEAFKKAIAEMRSATDVDSIVGSYQDSLDRVAKRGGHIDEATESMGVSADLGGSEDVHLDAEMRLMTGGEGATVGERNARLGGKFGDGKDKTEAK
jgi:hypothetical protein